MRTVRCLVATTALAFAGLVAAPQVAGAQCCSNSLPHYHGPLSSSSKLTTSASSNLGTFDIVINPTPGLAANPAALAAFNRAAAQWEAWIADPIQININADLAPLGAGTIGQTNQSLFGVQYLQARNAMHADSLPHPDESIVTSLPVSGTTAFPAASFPSGSFSGSIAMTSSNLKALGLIAGDEPSADATITFSSQFAFDFDNSDGITPNTMDFETVAAHEIGHALGFVSWVDQIAGGITNRHPTTLDLFRFDNGGPNDPSTAADFSTMPRSLIPGNDEIFDDTSNEWRMSTGVTIGADGRQASHWKDNELTGVLIGMLDPTLGFEQIFPITEADLRAMDLIGYDITIPEPASLAFVMLAGLALRRRRIG